MRSTPKLYLYKRTNGFYYIGYFDGGRLRWKSTHATRKTEALKAVSNFRHLVASNKNQIVSLSSFISEFMSYAETIYAPRTVIIYRMTLNRFLRMMGDCSLSSLSLRLIDRYKAERLRTIVPDSPTREHPKTLSPVTVNIELRSLKAALRTAVKWGLVETNPFAEAQQVRVPDKMPLFFTKVEFEKLVQVVEERWLKEMIVFAVCTGVRQGEMLNLRWQEVDLSRKLIYIQSTPNFKTKAGKRRANPMSEIVYALLCAKANHTRGEYVFTRKGRQITPSYVTHNFKKYLRKAGLREELHWHSLRATYGSWLVASGVPIFSVSKLLGHSSVSVTEKSYAALAPESLHNEVNKIQISMN